MWLGFTPRGALVTLIILSLKARTTTQLPSGVTVVMVPVGAALSHTATVPKIPITAVLIRFSRFSMLIVN